jgi:hypothetical protein
MTEWKLHHPLQSPQLQFAGQRVQVENAAVYHGGDELYQLKNVPVIWHEECLDADTENTVPSGQR